MKKIILTFFIFASTSALACPELSGRFLCDGLFGKTVHKYSKTRVDGVIEYTLIIRTRTNQREKTIRTDNVFRNHDPFEARSWCENNELHRFMFRGWDDRRQTHDVTTFINAEGDLETRDVARSYQGGEFQSETIHREVCRRL